MECDCGQYFSDEQMLAISEGRLKECPSCHAIFELVISEHSDARLPNSMDFDAAELFSDSDLILQELQKATKELFNRYGYDIEDFVIDIHWRLKSIELEDKYIIEENPYHRFIKFEK